MKNTTLEPGTEFFIIFPKKSGRKFSFISGEIRRKQEHKELFNILKDSEIVYDNFFGLQVIIFLCNHGKSEGCKLPIIYWFPNIFPPNFIGS